MTETLKYILQELNSVLSTNYDLIKFDSLSETQLLQILVDLLVKYDAGHRIPVAELEPEAVCVHILEMLQHVKFPAGEVEGGDASAFRGRLLAGERRTLLHVLHWLLSKREQAVYTAYLAKYLTRPNIPNDAASGLAELTEAYERLLHEFKLAHKRTRLTVQSEGSEIVHDIKEMSIERDIVIKRLETVQQQFTDIAEKDDLMNMSRALREHQERATELAEQSSDQEHQLHKIKQQLQRELKSFRGQSVIPKTVDEFIVNVGEEIQLNHYLVHEKFPQELSEIERELKVMQLIHDVPPTGRQDLIALQERIEIANREIETLVQNKMSTLNPKDDKLTPFRQQASVIKRNKEDIVDKLERLKSDLRDYEVILSDKNSKARQLVGDKALGGDDLKQYVNKLRNKSSVYKRQRAALSSLKMETEVLWRTWDILQAADPSIQMALVNRNKLNAESEEGGGEGAGASDDKQSNKPSMDLSKRTLNELSQMCGEAARENATARAELQAVSTRAAPVTRDHAQTLQLYQQKKRVYDSIMINLSSQVEPLEQQIRELKEVVEKKEGEWKLLRQKIDKAEQLKEVVENETKDFRNVTSPRQTSRVDHLHRQIGDMENTLRDLKEEQRALSERQSTVKQQSAMWSNVLELLQCKQQCRLNATQATPATITITHRTQTLTLQND